MSELLLRAIMSTLTPFDRGGTALVGVVVDEVSDVLVSLLLILIGPTFTNLLVLGR